MFSKFILGSYEFDQNSRVALSIINKEYGGLPTDKINAIDTAISYNNAENLSELLYNSKYKDIKIISKIAPHMHEVADLLMSNHLTEINRDYIDLMLIHNNRCDWYPIADKLIEWKNSGLCKEIGVSNFTIEDIENYNKRYGFYPAYNEFEINPNYTDHNLINYCKDHGIKIIAYCILGGKYNADAMIKYYTLSGLISYAGYYADHIIIRSDNPLHIIKDINSYNSRYIPDIDSKLDKVMVPMNYKSQIIMSRWNQIIAYNYNQDCREFTSMSNAVKEVESYKDYSELDEGSIKILNSFEFITDMRIYLKAYLRSKGHYVTAGSSNEFLVVDGRTINIYIIDKDDKLSKVNNEGSRILVKSVY